MPLFILVVGVMLVIVGINNKLPELGALVKEDFQPSDNTPAFHMWVIAIFIAGSLGYIKELKPVANAFLVLIVVGLMLSNRGFFVKFSNALEGKS